MLQKLLPLGAIALLPLFLPALVRSEVEPLAPDRAPATMIPERCLAYAEAPGLAALLGRGLEDPFLDTLLASPLGRALLAEAEQTPTELIAAGDAFLGRPVLPVLAALGTRGTALAATGDEEVVFLLHAENAEIVDQVLEIAFRAIEEKVGMPGVLADPARYEREAAVWSLGDDFSIAQRGALLVASNSRELLSDVLKLAADAQALGMKGREDFRRAYVARPGKELVWSWIDLDAIEEGPGGAAKLAELRGMSANPGVHSLLGSGIAALGTAGTLAGWIEMEGYELRLGVTGTDLAAADALLPTAGRDDFLPPAPLPAADQVAQALLYRDYAGLLAHRVDLFPPEMLPVITQKMGELSLFFGGRDLGEDVLPGVSPWIRVVSRPLAFEAGRAPEIPLPGVVLVVEVDDPEHRGAELVSAFQTVVGLINVDQAQKMGTAMQLRLGLEGDVEVSSARFPAPGPEDGVDMKYNLQPACAVAGGCFVIGTHEELVREVVRELARGERSSTGGTGEFLELDGAAVAKLIEENMETLVMQKVVDEGVPIAKAREEIGGLQLLASMIRGARAEVRYPREGTVNVQATIALHGPDGGTR